MSISKLGAHMQNPLFSKLYILRVKKSVPPIFLKRTFSWTLQLIFILINFFNFFAVETEKNGLGKLNLVCQSIQRGKKLRNTFFGYVGNFFWKICKTFIKVV